MTDLEGFWGPSMQNYRALMDWGELLAPHVCNMTALQPQSRALSSTREECRYVQNARPYAK